MVIAAVSKLLSYVIVQCYISDIKINKIKIKLK